MESAGERLKKIRLEKGISLEEAQKKTKIHIDILKSIEDGSFVSLNRVNLKGFIKIYCSFLGVDPSHYIASDSSEAIPIKVEVQGSQQEPSFKPLSDDRNIFIRRLVFGAIALLAVFLLLAGSVRLVKTIVSKITQANSNRAALSVSKKTKKTAAVKPVQKKQSQTIPAKTQTKPALTATSTPSVQTAASTKPNEFPIRITIQALEDCWILLKSDGKVVFQSILKKGRFESWQAKDKIDISLGSAGSVQLEVNGKLYPPLGKKGQVLKNILINKSGEISFSKK